MSTAPCALLALRHPAAVRASLAARDGFPARLSLLLWLRHMLDAEQGTRGIARAVVSYDALLQDWHSTMTRVGARLGLDWPAGLASTPQRGRSRSATAASPCAPAGRWTTPGWLG